ncbi:MAG: class I SAM-dependent methyltransferase [Planctomycetota bacterium]
MNNPNPTERFSDRAGHYELYRPTYPAALLEFMEGNLGLTPSSVVADIGAGTGLLSRLFLDHGNTVHAVEPNAPMRQSAEKNLGHFPGYTSHGTQAEDTGLPSTSIDLIVVGQAFHWFEVEPTRREFRRILRPGAWVALVWNMRQKASTPFLSEYEDLLCRLGLGYPVTTSDPQTGGLSRNFFPPGRERTTSLPHFQDLNLEALRGRLLSCSYAPLPGHPNHTPMMRELDALFEKHQSSGSVRIIYDTLVHYGQLG